MRPAAFRPRRPGRSRGDGRLSQPQVTTALLRLAGLLADGGPLADVLRRAAELILTTLPVDTVAIFRHDPALDADRPVVVVGLADSAPGLGDGGVSATETAEFDNVVDGFGFSIVERTAVGGGLHRRLLDGLGVERLLIVPLRYGARVGLLLLGAREPGEFSVAEIGLARGLADQLGLAVATGRLREINARRTRELAALHSAALATGGALDADTALRSICDQAARAFDADSAGIFLLHDDGSVLIGTHLGGEGRKEEQFALWRQLRVPVDAQTLLGEVWRSGSSVAVQDIEELPVEKAPGARRLGIRSMLIAPLRVDGQPGGLLVLCDRRPGVFSSADVPLAEALAEHASTAIARARTYAVALAHEEQTHFHAALLASVRDAVVATDLAGTIIYWNRGAEEIFGHPAAAQLNQPLTSLVPDRERRRLQRLLERVRRTGEERVEWPMRRADGLRIWVDMRFSLLHDPRGEPVGHLAVAKDITERRRAEEALERSARQILAQKTELEGILAHLGDGLMLADTQRRVLLINPAGRAILGIEEEDIGEPRPEIAYWHAVTPEGTPIAEDDLPLARGLAGERGPARELEVIVRGETRIISVSAAPLCTPEGKLHGAVAVLRDVTEIRRTQERVVESERLRALGEMASGVAHDFNNLLAVILGRCELLLRPTPGAEGSWNILPHLEVIKQAAIDGAETVKRLQAFSGVSRATPEEAMDLGAIVRDVVEFSRPRWKDAAQQRGITIEMKTEVEPLPPVQGSPAELREVMVNMVFNAVDAMPHGGTITLSVQRAGDEVRLRIADTGVGMTEAVRRRIFEPFFTTKGTRGAGLGLSMSYGIIARMGGRIEVESALYQGTTFTIILPFVPMTVQERRPADQEAQPLSIFLVDDEPQMLRTAAMLLEMDGHRVTTAGSGGEALAHLTGGTNHPHYDVVLTDLGMPGMNGLQLVAALRNAGIRTPCVLVTGWGMELSSEDVKSTGAQGVLPKPFSADQLRSVLAEVVAVRAMSAA